MRTEMLNMNEFLALPRSEEGRILNMYDNFLFMTPEMVKLLETDDFAYYYDLKEEIEYEMNALREEFGI